MAEEGEVNRGQELKMNHTINHLAALLLTSLAALHAS
jgi:hypothetical protein